MRPASRTRASVPRPPAPNLVLVYNAFKPMLPMDDWSTEIRPTWLILGNSCSSKPREAQKYHSISNETDAA